jgi:hypothetical protein
MSYKDLQKDDRILEIVKYLFDKFGDDCFKVRDYWDADLCAIGLSDNSEKYLFYISTYNKQEDHYFISLENTTSGDDFPYESVGDFDEVKLNELERLFKQHLRI